MIRMARTWCLWLLGGSIAPALALGQGGRPVESAGPDAGVNREIPGGNPARSSPVIGEATSAGRADGHDNRALTKPVMGPYPIQRPPFQTRPSASSFDALEANFGLSLTPVDEVLRAQLDITSGQGVVAFEIRPGSLAEQAGLKVNDVLMILGDQRVMGVNQARGILLAIGKEALEVKLIREGKPRRMSLVGPEHGFPPESSEFWIGVPVSPVDSTLRSHLADLPPDVGLVVNEVTKDSPADRSGVRKSDILISMGGKPLKSADSLIEQVHASGGKPVPLVLFRASKMSTVEVTPAKRAHPTVIKLGGRPGDRDTFYRVVRPNVAVEIDPQSTWAFPFYPPTKYDPIVVHPHNVAAAPLGQPSRPIAARAPIDIQFDMDADMARLNANFATARIEAQLKELSAKVEEVRRAVEGMRKAVGD